jgi:5-formyltetrahydrofolate cyclo-ligase
MPVSSFSNDERAHPRDPATPSRAQASRALARQALRTRRGAFAGSDAFAGAQAQALQRLSATVAQLEPECLGLFAPMPGEFNPATLPSMLQNASHVGDWAQALKLALPFAWREQGRMVYRLWRGQSTSQLDECGIPTGEGPDVVPDVVVVPCVGYTREGYRLGYGGGYFDRWLSAHPHVTAIGLAWSGSELTAQDFSPEPHDIALMGIVTDAGVFSD